MGTVREAAQRTCSSFSGVVEVWTLSLSKKAVVPEAVTAAPQQASRSGSCTGRTAGQGHPVELSAVHSALCSELPSCAHRGRLIDRIACLPSKDSQCTYKCQQEVILLPSTPLRMRPDNRFSWALGMHWEYQAGSGQRGVPPPSQACTWSAPLEVAERLWHAGTPTGADWLHLVIQNAPRVGGRLQAEESSQAQPGLHLVVAL